VKFAGRGAHWRPSYRFQGKFPGSLTGKFFPVKLPEGFPVGLPQRATGRGGAGGQAPVLRAGQGEDQKPHPAQIFYEMGPERTGLLPALKGVAFYYL
jgi:hypothetical protein